DQATFAYSHPAGGLLDCIGTLVLNDDAVLQRFRVGCLIERGIGLSEEVEVCTAEDFRKLALKERREGRVGRDVAVVRVLHQHWTRNGVDERVEEGLRLCKGALGVLLRSDFASHAPVAAKVASLVEERLATQADPLLHAASIEAAIGEVAE